MVPSGFFFRVFYVVICAFSLSLVSCNGAKHAKTSRLPGRWQATPIVVDGDSRDWPSPYPEYDEKAMLGYTVSNDKENLYITVETGDPATQLKILKEGLTVWIDRKGEKNEETAINFPIPVAATRTRKGDNDDESARPPAMRLQDGQGANRELRQRMDLEDRVRAAMKTASQYSLQGFKSCNLQYAISEKDSCGVEVKIGLDSMNELVWEAVVPFKSFYFKPEISRPDKGRVLTVCFETTGTKRPAGDAGGSRGGGGLRPGVGYGGMGMGMGMGMRGGSMRNRNNSSQPGSNLMESLYKSTKTYKKFGLAYQQ